MTAQNTLARIARTSVPVMIGVALLASGVPFVVLALWVLLLAVPLLVTLRLVLSLLDGAAQSTPARSARIVVLAISGVALLATGVSSLLTLWSTDFARFMYLEDLGLDGTWVTITSRVTSVDRGILVFGGILAVIGAAALIAVAMLVARHRGRAER